MAMKRIVLVACAAIFFSASSARAHYLWVDPTAEGGPAVRFGEYEESLIERSPGRLDDMAATRVSVADRPVGSTVMADRIAFAAGEGATVTAANLDSAVKDWRASGIGFAKPLYYARYGAGGTAMELDILPEGENQVRVVFQGKPLAKAKVAVHAPNGWTREETADAQGYAHIRSPWSGLYVLEVIHSEPIKGAEGGKSFDSRRHRATLSLVKQASEPTSRAASAANHDR